MQIISFVERESLQEIRDFRPKYKPSTTVQLFLISSILSTRGHILHLAKERTYITNGIDQSLFIQHANLTHAQNIDVE